jgi:hypothetical protein
LSLTELISDGFWKIKEASSSIREMFFPPKAIAWEDVGRFRKSKMFLPPWACDVRERAKSKIGSAICNESFLKLI